MTSRRFSLGLAAAVLGLGTLATAGAANAAPNPDPGPSDHANVIEVPYPPVQVTEVCGARNDVLTIDPQWLAQWGNKVLIYPKSLTFQGGDDHDTAKPAGQILPKFRGQFRWVGSSVTGWDRWALYPGSVAPIVDRATPCPTTTAVPVLTQTTVCGPHNDTVAFADPADAQRWFIESEDWRGQRLTVVLRAQPGFVGPDGTDTATLQFTDDVKCAAA